MALRVNPPLPLSLQCEKFKLSSSGLCVIIHVGFFCLSLRIVTIILRPGLAFYSNEDQTLAPKVKGAIYLEATSSPNSNTQITSNSIRIFYCKCLKFTFLQLAANGLHKYFLLGRRNLCFFIICWCFLFSFTRAATTNETMSAQLWSALFNISL